MTRTPYADAMERVLRFVTFMFLAVVVPTLCQPPEPCWGAPPAAASAAAQPMSSSTPYLQCRNPDGSVYGYADDASPGYVVMHTPPLGSEPFAGSPLFNYYESIDGLRVLLFYDDDGDGYSDRWAIWADNNNDGHHETQVAGGAAG